MTILAIHKGILVELKDALSLLERYILPSPWVPERKGNTRDQTPSFFKSDVLDQVVVC